MQPALHSARVFASVAGINDHNARAGLYRCARLRAPGLIGRLKIRARYVYDQARRF